MTWLEAIVSSNRKYQKRVEKNLPFERKPCPYAVITCMDPRVDLSSMGILPFSNDGKANSDIRIIRTIGGMADLRSLAISIHLAGIREIAVLMHTDCGLSIAFEKTDLIAENMEKSLGSKYEKLRTEIGEPFKEKLSEWLMAFSAPYSAVKKEVARIKENPIVPYNIAVHGLVLDLSTGKIDVTVNGYED